MKLFFKTAPAIFLLFFSLSINAQTYSGTGGFVPDNSGPVFFPITVSGLSPSSITPGHGLKSICMNMTHTYTGDLIFSLIAPDGTFIPLMTNIGGGGHNFTNTCFDTTGSMSIDLASAPFTGTFIPEGNPGQCNNGQNGNGTWIMQVQDTGPADTGSLWNWSITFGNNAPHPSNFVNEIPLVVVNTNNASIPFGTNIPANMKIIDHGTGNLNHEIDNGNIYSGNIDIHIRGSYSASLPQKPYTFTTKSVSGIDDTNVVLLNMPEESSWILQAVYNDKSFVRNTMMFHEFQLMGHYAPRSAYCELVLNGQYQGIYILMEKIKRGPDRVNIAKLTAADTTGDQLTGGYIFKHDYDQDWLSQYAAPNCPSRIYNYNYYYPKNYTILPQQAAYCKEYVDSFENILYSNHVYDSIAGYRSVINLASFIDYLLVNELSRNGDGFKKSMFFYKDKNSVNGGHLFAGPVWDFDWAMKNVPWCPTDGSGWMYNTDPCDGDVLYLPWWNIMMQDSFFTNELKCRWLYFRDHFLDTTHLNQYMDSIALYCNLAQQRHYTRWPIMGQNVGTPEINPVAATFADEIDSLKAIMKERIIWMDAHLPGTCTNSVTLQTDEFKEQDQISLYPNPSDGYFHLKYFGEQVKELRILDVQGRKIAGEKYEGQNSLDLRVLTNGWPAGIYFVHIVTGSQTISRKLVVGNY